MTRNGQRLLMLIDDEPAQRRLVSALAARGGWRSVFDGRFLCQAPRQTTVFDSPAATLSCTRRQGGWPHVVLAVRLGGTLYVADGVKPIEAEGQKFDPHRHQAMFEVPDPSRPEGTVVQVVQAGFAIGDRVLRPAMVGVSKGGPKIVNIGEAPEGGVDKSA